ncbi:hypothetical protein [Halomonas sp. RA08-2]|uniref:hypothetical protein n=1 Tax=Halomonas sp. RA08-2 TaxID=3440842 RepID=UPI003EEF5C91
MNKNPVEKSAGDDKAKKGADGHHTEKKGGTEKHGEKDGAVLKDINDNARKDKK